MPLEIVAEDVVRRIVTWPLVIDAVRSAFVAAASGDMTLFDVLAIHGLEPNQRINVKSGCDTDRRLVGLKCGTYWPGNHDHQLPPHGSTILLLDSATGFPRALISAAHLNRYRTAAANAVAVQALARNDAHVLGVIGAGHQAEFEIRAILQVRPIERVKVFSRSDERSEWILRQLGDLDQEIELTSADNAVRDSDIVCTVTPAAAPVLQSGWVSPGTHISAMGCDARGKQELDIDLYAKARLFADHPAQSVAIGEFQHALGQGVIEAAGDITAIGDVIRGQKPGRESQSDITVFDSSGIAIQDLACANALLIEARTHDALTTIPF